MMPYFSLQLKKSLNRILEYPLTLIEADSGCGKTTAINSYFLPIVAKDYQQYVYTSLGTSAERSWMEFCRLLSHVDTQAAHYLEAMGIPDGDTMSEAAYQISNLICERPSVICLDNFQLMNFPEKKRLIQALSLHRCQNLHFVILTQARIRRLAARACVEERDYIRAAILYGRVKDYDALLSLPFSTHDWIELVSLEKGEILKELIAPAYCEKLLQYPELAVLFCFELYIRGNYILHRQYLKAVGRMLDRENSYSPARYRYLRGEYALIQSFLVFNDVEKMHAYHKEAFSLLQGPTRLLTRLGCWTFGSPSIVSLYWREPGKFGDALQAVQTSMPAYYSLTNGNGRGGPEAMEAEALLLQGEEKKSFSLFCQAVYEAEQFEQDCVCYCARFGMARLALIQGNCGSFMQMKEKIHDMAYKGTEPSRVFTAALCEAYFHMLLGEYDEVPGWLCNETALRRRTYVFSLPFVHILNGRLMLEQYLKGKIPYEEFEETMALYIQECEKLHVLLPKVYYKIYLSICREHAGRMKEAMDTFREMLSLVSADNVWLPPAELYEELQPMINKMAARREASPGLEQIEKLGKKYRIGIKKIQRQLRPQGASLTPREREVAALLKRRYSVKEIAEQLVIYPSTVSNTMQKIYSKLGIHSKKELYVRDDI